MKRYIVSSYEDMYSQRKPFTSEQRQMKKATHRNNEELAIEMLENLSDTKKVQLDKMLERNFMLTSTYACSYGVLRVYKEGWYLTLHATRADFSVWYYDNDGELIEGRKPNESKLHFLYEDSLDFKNLNESKWAKLTEL